MLVEHNDPGLDRRGLIRVCQGEGQHDSPEIQSQGGLS
jgi:hypothetical protein